MQVYLAAPFFNPAQIQVVRSIECLLTKLDISHFSPSRDQPQLGTEGGSPAEIYKGNINALHNATCLLACIDDRDSGVMFEMGYFKALMQVICGTRKIIAFTTHGYGLNLMLTESTNGFLKSLDEIVAYFNCDGAVTCRWTGEVI